MAQDEIERKMDEILIADPELTFRDVLVEMVNKGDLPYEALGSPHLHMSLFSRYARAKQRAGMDRVNTDI